MTKRDCLPCPECGNQPHWHPSMIRDAEAITCETDGCEFDFDTGYLPDMQAVASWNAAVAKGSTDDRT
jgi:hypothetical protein